MYNTDKTKLENKIANVTNFAKKTKLPELENKIADISNLATKTALTTVVNKIPDVSSLVKKKILILRCRILTEKFPQNKTKHLPVESELTTLENKIPDISNVVRKVDYNAKIAAMDTNVSNLDGKIAGNKNELVKNILEDNKVLALLLMGNILLDSGDSSQAYLVFQPVHKYITIIANTKLIS